jgi:type I restriction enzyme S subunit
VPYCAIPESDEKRFRLEQGDLLFARTGGTVGKSHLYLDSERAVFASYLIRLRCGPRLLPEYAALWFSSPQYWRQLRAGVAGTGQPNFNGTKLAQLVVALPPVEEQRRIVAVVDRLLALTSELKVQLTV